MADVNKYTGAERRNVINKYGGLKSSITRMKNNYNSDSRAKLDSKIQTYQRVEDIKKGRTFSELNSSELSRIYDIMDEGKREAELAVQLEKELSKTENFVEGEQLSVQEFLELEEMCSQPTSSDYYQLTERFSVQHDPQYKKQGNTDYAELIKMQLADIRAKAEAKI